MAFQINRAITRKFKNKTFTDKYSHSVLFVAKQKIIKKMLETLGI